MRNKIMNRGKLKVLIMALKEVVEELESEIYSDVEAYQSVPVGDYEEVFEDDDGYPDWGKSDFLFQKSRKKNSK